VCELFATSPAGLANFPCSAHPGTFSANRDKKKPCLAHRIFKLSESINLRGQGLKDTYFVWQIGHILYQVLAH
jgi:hypothetical protein